jgi:hypothetical protein
MTSSSPVRVELLEQTDDYAVAAWRRLMLLVWRGPATVTGIERSRDLLGPWVERQPGGGAFFIVVPGQLTRPPDEAAREAMKRVTREPEGPFKGMATLIQAEGFIAASVRSVMTRLHGGGAARVFRTADEAAAWAAALPEDPELTPAGLEEVIRAAREG